MTNKKVSVIIPVYNTVNYLAKCLDSVLSQTLEDIEIVVVIDASPDNAIEVVRGYQKHDGRIKIVDKVLNEGLAAARNSGVDASSGKYIIHLDSDDFWIDNNMLRELYEIAVMEGCDILRFNGYAYKDNQLTALITNKLDLINGHFNEDKELWCYRSVFLYFFRRNFVEANQLSFVNGICLGEDGIFLSSALVAAKNISATSKCYYAYRIRPSSMMKRNWAIDKFIEEETASQIIANNISKNQAALHNYLYNRINIYWVSTLAAKAARDLSKSERMRFYAFARENLVKLDTSLSPRLKLLHIGGRLLHRHFVSSDFRKLDRAICVIRYLVIFLPVVKWLISCRAMLWNLSKRVLKKLACTPACTLYALIAKEKVFENIELLDEYNFTLPKRRKLPGISAMLRVKNEERRIRACIESIIDVFDEIVVVDNGSDDSTLEIVSALMRTDRYAEKIKVFSYPHRIARCGSEHAATPEKSVHSLAYYYNWCLSKCSCRMVCKWDADMLLSSELEHRAAFESFLSDLINKRTAWLLGSFPIQTIYIDDEDVPYRAVDEINEEVRVSLNSSLVCYAKGDLWEALSPLIPMPVKYFPETCVFEVKDVADNEFSHWTTTQFKGTRKVREYRNYMRVKNNWHKGNATEFVRVRSLDSED